MVLLDSDVFIVGFNNFDFNDWFKIDNDNLGIFELIENCKKYKLSMFFIIFVLSEEEVYY